MPVRKPKPKPTKIVPCRYDSEQVHYIERKAEAEGHGNVSRVLRRLVDRDRGAA